MSTRYIKRPTVESGSFNSTNQRFRIKLDCGMGNAYNLRDSYLLLDVQPDGPGTNPAGVEAGSGDGVFNFKFGDSNDVRYLPSCLIENVQLISSTKGVIESNMKRNALVQTMLYRTKNFEERRSLYKYGMGNATNKVESIQDTPFLNRVTNGTTLSNVKNTEVLIPLSDLIELGKYETVPYANVGALELQCEMETVQQIFTDDKLLFDPELAEYVCDDQDTNTDPRNELTLTTPAASILDCPFTRTTDQEVIIFYKVAGNQKHVITTFDAAVDFTIAANKITMTFAVDVLPAATACTDISMSHFNGDPTKSELSVVPFQDLVAPGKVLTTTNDMAVTDDNLKLYVGQLITIKYMDATPETKQTTRRIVEIAANGSKLDITFDGTADIPISTALYGFSRGSTASEGGASPRAIINRADIVYAEEKAPSGKVSLTYNKISVEPFNKPNSLSYFERIYQLDQGTYRILMLNINDSLVSQMQNVGSYRLFYDNKPNTDGNIVPRSPLYLDRIMRSYGKEIRDLASEDGDEFIITDLVQTERPDPLLMVRISASGGTLGDNDILYLMKYVPQSV